QYRALSSATAPFRQVRTFARGHLEEDVLQRAFCRTDPMDVDSGRNELSGQVRHPPRVQFQMDAAVLKPYRVVAGYLHGDRERLVERLRMYVYGARPTQFGHGALGEQSAVRDDAHPVADLLDLAEQVAGQQDRAPVR